MPHEAIRVWTVERGVQVRSQNGAWKLIPTSWRKRWPNWLLTLSAGVRSVLDTLHLTLRYWALSELWKEQVSFQTSWIICYCLFFNPSLTEANINDPVKQSVKIHLCCYYQLQQWLNEGGPMKAHTKPTFSPSQKSQCFYSLSDAVQTVSLPVQTC